MRLILVKMIDLAIERHHMMSSQSAMNILDKCTTHDIR